MSRISEARMGFQYHSTKTEIFSVDRVLSMLASGVQSSNWLDAPACSGRSQTVRILDTDRHHILLIESIKTARTGAGITQSSLAAQLGVARLAVTRLEAGKGSTKLVMAAMTILGLRLCSIGRGVNLPDQLRRRRLARRWTIEQVSSRTGLTRSTIASVEAGGGSFASLVKLLAAVAPEAKVCEAPRSSWDFDPTGLAARDERMTPSWLLTIITSVFGDIGLDPCSHPQSNVVAQHHITLPECGIASSWAGNGLVFANPPFSDLSRWLQKAQDEWECGGCETIMLLCPTRTEYEVFQSRISRDADVLLLAGRMRFDAPSGRPTHPAPFAMMILVWGASDATVQQFMLRVPSVRITPWGNISGANNLAHADNMGSHDNTELARCGAAHTGA